LNRGLFLCVIGLLVLRHALFVGTARGQAEQTPGAGETSQGSLAQPRVETTQDYNQRLQELLRAADGRTGNIADQDYRVGPDDLLDVSVLEAPDLNRTVRVSAEGDISLPLLGSVRAMGLTPSGLAGVLEELLRRTYMKDPHVGVFLKEMQSHPVSILGAVAKPGVYQIRGAKTLVEMLSMAQGLAPDAGDKVIVERQGSELVAQTHNAGDPLPTPAAGSATDQISPNTQIPDGTSMTPDRGIEIQLKQLMNSRDPGQNVLVYPGDVVKVARADVVYVVGEVRKPGGFQLNTNENISVLQALALAEGLTRTSAATRSRVIRTDQATGNRTEIPIDIRRILAGKVHDPMLQARDIVFVPNSTGKIALYRGVESALGIGSSLLIYRAP
jgi:polysaccharide export outer membrane protein